MKIYATDNPNILDTPDEVFEFLKQYCGKGIWIKCYNNLYRQDVFVKPQYVDEYEELLGVEITLTEMSEINYPDQSLSGILRPLTYMRPLYGHRYVIDTSNLVTLTTKELCSNYPESIEAQVRRYAGKDIWVYATSSQNRFDLYWIRILEVKDDLLKYNVMDATDLSAGSVTSIYDTIESLDDVKVADIAAFTINQPVEVMSTEELLEYIRNCEELYD